MEDILEFYARLFAKDIEVLDKGNNIKLERVVMRGWMSHCLQCMATLERQKQELCKYNSALLEKLNHRHSVSSFTSHQLLETDPFKAAIEAGRQSDVSAPTTDLQEVRQESDIARADVWVQEATHNEIRDMIMEDSALLEQDPQSDDEEGIWFDAHDDEEQIWFDAQDYQECIGEKAEDSAAKNKENCNLDGGIAQTFRNFQTYDHSDDNSDTLTRHVNRWKRRPRKCRNCYSLPVRRGSSKLSDSIPQRQVHSEEIFRRRLWDEALAGKMCFNQSREREVALNIRCKGR